MINHLQHFKFLFYLNLIVLLTACVTVPLDPDVSNPPLAKPIKPLIQAKRPVVAIVLGGGATRGFAHIGVLNVLDEHGINVDIVIGSSSGSIAGALYAGGFKGTHLIAAAKHIDRRQLADWMVPNRGVLRGRLLQDFINAKLQDRPIEALDKVFVAVATDLFNGKITAFTHGNTGMAVRASSTIPGLIQPVVILGREYVDGGLVSQVPVKIAQRFKADIIIAVDITRKPLPTNELSTTLAIMHQALIIMAQQIKRFEVKEADILISPAVGDISMNDFDLRDYAIFEGRQAALNAIPVIKNLINKYRKEKQKESIGSD